MGLMKPRVPVFLRLGDGEECEIGSVSPDVTLAGIPEQDWGAERVLGLTASVDILGPLAELFRQMAAEIEKVASGN